jgi:tRNA threonylcarbamoyladenosine biosynthesis protein TsaE
LKTSYTFISDSPDETKKWGARVGRELRPGDVLLFLANLGAGKTTFTQGLIKSLKINEDALSPTFVIVQSFAGRYPVHHLDFYRLSKKEILDMGIQDYLLGEGEIAKGIVLIEWAERCPDIWPKEHLEIHMKALRKENSREIKIVGIGDRFSGIVKKIKGTK